MDWQSIPDLPLQHIFAYLPKRERLFAALSCRRWFDAFFNPQLWRTFVFRWRPDQIGMRKLWYDIALYHLFREFKAVGRHYRRIIVPANHDYYALHGFLQQWGRCLARHAKAGAPIPVHTFHFTFASEVIGGQTFGTGGQLLDALKDALSRHQFLRNLVLDDLLLDVTDALTLLEDIICVSALLLRRLSVVSVCKEPAGFYAAALFPNLQLLRLSPLQLNADVLEGVISETQLERLVLRQDRFTMWPEEHPMAFNPPTPEQWRRALKRVPSFRVRFEVCGLSECRSAQPNGLCPVMWPARFAPIDEVIFNYPRARSAGLMLDSKMVSILADYSDTLVSFGHTSLHLDRTSDEEDEEEPLICEEDFAMQENVTAWSDLTACCPNLQALYFSSCVTTWFLMLVAASAQRLFHLSVRRDKVIGEPCPTNGALLSAWRGIPEEVISALRQCSASTHRSEHEIAYILKQPSWRYLSDVEFQRNNPTNEDDFLREY